MARRRRLAEWDYAKGASLFITISTEPRRAALGRVVDGEVELTQLGKIVDEALCAMPKLNPGIMLFKRVVMPDHVHFLVHIKAGLNEPLKVLGKAIGRFKVYTTKQAKLFGVAGHSPATSTAIGLSPIASTRLVVSEGDKAATCHNSGQVKAEACRVFWQEGYHDWLVLSRETIEAVDRYIVYNPLKWQLMYGMPGYLKIKEPLACARLDMSDYWKGVGNTALLDSDIPMVSLRVSMKVKNFEPFLAKMRSAVDKGWVVISGFISKGEREVFKMLAANKNAKFIRMRPSCIPNARFKPESMLVDAFSEGRYLEIAKGNDEVDFSRNACLDLNDEIVAIATSGKGLAIHWREDGAKIIERGESCP